MVMLSTRIIPDKPGDRYLCGETISGTVEVVVHEECKGRQLMLALGCRGTAQAPRQEIIYLTDTEQKTLFTGEWMPGTYEYPFSVIAPDGYSYKGTIMTVGWYLRTGVIEAGATVVRYTKQDSDLEGEDRRDILLVPGEIARNDMNRKEDSRVVRKETAASLRGCLLPSLFILLVGIMAAWWGRDKGLSFPGSVVAVGGAVLTGVAVWQALIARKIAMIELRIGATVVWPGEQIPCSIVVKARAPFEIEQATLTLEGWEHVKKYTGMYRSTGPENRHFVHKEVWEMQLPLKRLPAGASVELTGECRVPGNAIGTMDFDNEVKILWRLEPRVRITGSPDWFDLQPITVLPRVPVHE